MTRPTGKPRGRPKTQFYTTLMARVPEGLADRARRYAGRKRQTISEVLRDGLLVLLQEDDPYREFASDSNAETDIISDIIGPTSSILSDTKEDSPAITSDVNTVVPIVSDAITDFDHDIYMLGKLCPKKHEHGTTGKSVLNRKSRACRECQREDTRHRRQAKSQTQPA